MTNDERFELSCWRTGIIARFQESWAPVKYLATLHLGSYKCTVEEFDTREEAVRALKQAHADDKSGGEE